MLFAEICLNIWYLNYSKKLLSLVKPNYLLKKMLINSVSKKIKVKLHLMKTKCTLLLGVQEFNC